MFRTKALLGVLALVSVVVAAACGGTTSVGLASIPTGERTYFMTGLEYKGATVTKDLAAPDQDPAKLSDGYRYKLPGKVDADPTKWEVSSYRFEPGVMQALVGDKVSLLVFITNGDKHNTWVEGPNGKEVVAKVAMSRGREYKLNFTASQAGVYRIICEEHDPTMTSYLWALPR